MILLSTKSALNATFLLSNLITNIKINMATAPGNNRIGGTETHQKQEVEAKTAELQGIRKDIAHLMKTSEEYGGPFESIEATTLKTFSDVHGDSKKNLVAVEY